MVGRYGSSPMAAIEWLAVRQLLQQQGSCGLQMSCERCIWRHTPTAKERPKAVKECPKPSSAQACRGS